MKIIFIKDLKHQGKKGEIKEVKDGYAQNYLIKKGFAIRLTVDSKQALIQEEAKQIKIDKDNRNSALELKKKLEKETFTFKVKTGKQDKVFGSISPKQIKDKLKENNYDIDKNQIEITNSLTSLGFHTIHINLYKDVIADLKIELIK